MTLNVLLPLANHLWQSSLCVALAWLLTISLKNNRAAARYGIWFAASVKFLVPFSLLVSAGGQFGWLKTPSSGQPQLSIVIGEISEPFTPPISAATHVLQRPDGSWIVMALLSVWLCGFVTCVFLWHRSWQKVRRIQRGARHLDLGLPIAAMSCQTNFEPGVFGILSPVLLLPEGITKYLAPDQLNAIIEHELSHVRRRDNLTAAIHMVVEAIFWFHPMIWWIRERLADEREIACDEQVLRAGNDPESYAEGILNACRYYHESRLACVSGVTGADLRRRIEVIVSRRSAPQVSPAKRLFLATTGVAAILGPFSFGLINAPVSLGQTQGPSSKPVIEVASIRPNRTGGRSAILFAPANGRPMANNVTLKYLIKWAYNVEDYQISGGPKWIDSAAFDISAKLEHDIRLTGDPVQRGYFREMIQPLLADRFKLAFHRTTRELPLYALVVAKGGLKLKELEILPDPTAMRMSGGRGLMVGQRIPISILTEALTSVVGRPVRDETSLKGFYDFRLQWDPADTLLSPDGNDGNTPSATDHTSPSIFTAVQEQLGLRLESRKGPVDVLAIEHAEMPTEN